jgi:hypothetical protein
MLGGITAGRGRSISCGPCDMVAWALLAILATMAAFTLGDYAVSNDEEVQHRYGELIVAYYASGFTDDNLFAYRNLYLYGGLFDILAVLVSKLLPYDAYLIRHGLSAAAGIAGVAAAWGTARMVAGPRAGLIAAVMLAVTAQWYGPMFNHTKDIPFAAAMTGASYFLLRAARDLPAPRWRDVLGFALLLGAACGLRAMGLLLFGYAGLILLVYFMGVARREPMALALSLRRAASRFVPAFALGYAIMLAAWPWAALDLLNPLRAIFAFSHFHYEIRTIFAGKVYTMADVPRWYVPAYLAIRLPLVLWAGALLAALVALRAVAKPVPHAGRTTREIGWLWFFVLFPLACQVAARGPAFTGIRHFLFVVPLLAILAGVGFDALLARLAARWPRTVMPAALALIAALLWEASYLVRLHPHQHLYYNALVGGLPGAAGRYETDYWVNIMPEAVGALERYVERLDAGDESYLVGVCGERFSFEHEAHSRLRWSVGWYEADFFIAPTHMNCDRANNGNVVVRIERLGVLVGVVKDRRGFPPPVAAENSR